MKKAKNSIRIALLIGCIAVLTLSGCAFSPLFGIRSCSCSSDFDARAFNDIFGCRTYGEWREAGGSFFRVGGDPLTNYRYFGSVVLDGKEREAMYYIGGLSGEFAIYTQKDGAFTERLAEGRFIVTGANLVAYGFTFAAEEFTAERLKFSFSSLSEDMLTPVELFTPRFADKNCLLVLSRAYDKKMWDGSARVLSQGYVSLIKISMSFTSDTFEIISADGTILASGEVSFIDENTATLCFKGDSQFAGGVESYPYLVVSSAYFRPEAMV